MIHLNMSSRLRAAILRQTADGQRQVDEALALSKGNWTKAAELLEITYRQLRYIMADREGKELLK